MNKPDIKDYFLGKSVFRDNEGNVVLDKDGKEQERWNYDYEKYYPDCSKYELWKKATHQERLTKEFKKRGIVRAELEFSGGNDSGGVDSVCFYDKDGEEVDTVSRHMDWVTDPVTNEYGNRELTDDQLADNEFGYMVEEVVGRKWGSWAGDFFDSGNMTFDISKEFATAHNGGYYTMQYEASSSEYHTEEG